MNPSQERHHQQPAPLPRQVRARCGLWHWHPVHVRLQGWRQGVENAAAAASACLYLCACWLSLAMTARPPAACLTMLLTVSSLGGPLPVGDCDSMCTQLSAQVSSTLRGKLLVAAAPPYISRLLLHPALPIFLPRHLVSLLEHT